MPPASSEPPTPSSGETADVPSAETETSTPSKQAAPFWRRCPLTVGFSVLLIAIYLLSSLTEDFQRPARWIVELTTFIPELVADGQWWRIVTATLMHGHPMYLLGNLVMILIMGNLLEPTLGGRRLLILYAISVVSGLFWSFLLLPQTGAYGASTINYGSIGFYLSITLLGRFYTDRPRFWRELQSAGVFLVMFVLWDQSQRGTANMWGHLGGLFGGTVYAFWLARRWHARF